MRFHYYRKTDSLYIDLSEKASTDSREVAPGVVLDLDAAGRLVGIDLDHAGKRGITMGALLLGVTCVVAAISVGLRVRTRKMYYATQARGMETATTSLATTRVSRSQPPASRASSLPVFQSSTLPTVQ